MTLTCRGCGTDVSDVEQSQCKTYERIEIPKIEPDVTRMSLHGGVCRCEAVQSRGAGKPGAGPRRRWQAP